VFESCGGNDVKSLPFLALQGMPSELLIIFVRLKKYSSFNLIIMQHSVKYWGWSGEGALLPPQHINVKHSNNT